MPPRNDNKILNGRGEIEQYLNVSKRVFYQFLEMGLPARVINKRWYAHKDNVDEFFKKLTRYREKNIPMDVE